MAWRAARPEERQASGAARKAAMEQRVRAGVSVGLLGYLDGAAVAWCSIAPKPTYRKLGGIDVPAQQQNDVWSLVCFFLRRDLRGRGLAPHIIAAALEQARMGGAKIVEAYPVDPGSPSYRFMGYVPDFQAAGFTDHGMAGTRRHVMRIALDA